MRVTVRSDQGAEDLQRTATVPGLCSLDTVNGASFGLTLMMEG